MPEKRDEAQTFWVLERADHPRFPFRLTIVNEGQTLLALRVADRWPGSKGNIFCLRESGRDWPPPTDEVERVPVTTMRRYGKRLSITLDRPTRKRCDFLFLKKPYKYKEGEYEQIFWQTQKGMRERRPRARFTIRAHPSIHVLIDTYERYPWRFSGCTVERWRLPMGDYALLLENEIAALIERKTFEDLLRRLTDLRIFHQQLGELAAYPLAALVIEADYADFLKPKKTSPLSPRYCTRALAELAVLHPDLIVHFAGSRKLANEWARAFFLAAAGYAEDRPLLQVQEAVAGYGSAPPAKGGLILRIRKAILEDFPPEFAFQALRDNFPQAPEATLRLALQQMRDRGEVECRGRGRAARWIKTI